MLIKIIVDIGPAVDLELPPAHCPPEGTFFPRYHLLSNQVSSHAQRIAQRPGILKRVENTA